MDRPDPLRFLSPIHKASGQIGRFLEGPSAELGLRNVEAHLLAYLNIYAPQPVRRLAAVFGHRGSTLTSILDRLEKRGLLARRLNPDDRRSLLVDITARGRRRANTVRELVEALEDDIANRIRPRDLEGFRNVMSAIADATAIEIARKNEEKNR